SRPSRGLAALSPSVLLLGRRSALLRTSARPGLLTAAAGGAWRIRDPRGAFLRHALALEGLVLLLVLHAWSLVGHLGAPLSAGFVSFFACHGRHETWLRAEDKGMAEIWPRRPRSRRRARSSPRWANPP